MAKKKSPAAVKERNKYTTVDVVPSACPMCSCTEREPYFAIRRLAVAGTSPSGVEYTQITWKRTRCKRCGQRRVDRVFESLADDSVLSKKGD